MVEALVIAGGYLLGSMPFGYWVVRVFRHEDVRERGSGNIGATNVWRVYGRRYGIPVLLLDVAKGFVPALVGVLVGLRRGGKTVATAGGVLWAVAPLVALAAAGVWLVLFVVFRYASVSSMGAAVSLPLLAWLLLPLLAPPHAATPTTRAASATAIFSSRRN